MNGIKTKTYGSQKVVWDHAVDILAGGVHVEKDSLKRFKDSVLPAGTLISVKQENGMHKAVTVTADKTSGEVSFDVEPLGQTHFDIQIDDMPLA